MNTNLQVPNTPESARKLTKLSNLIGLEIDDAIRERASTGLMEIDDIKSQLPDELRNKFDSRILSIYQQYRDQNDRLMLVAPSFAEAMNVLNTILALDNSPIVYCYDERFNDISLTCETLTIDQPTSNSRFTRMHGTTIDIVNKNRHRMLVNFFPIDNSSYSYRTFELAKFCTLKWLSFSKMINIIYLSPWYGNNHPALHLQNPSIIQNFNLFNPNMNIATNWRSKGTYSKLSEYQLLEVLGINMDLLK